MCCESLVVLKKIALSDKFSVDCGFARLFENKSGTIFKKNESRMRRLKLCMFFHAMVFSLNFSWVYFSCDILKRSFAFSAYATIYTSFTPMHRAINLTVSCFKIIAFSLCKSKFSNRFNDSYF